MIWDLHGLPINVEWDDPQLGDRWQTAFASRPPSDDDPQLSFSVQLVGEVPAPPTEPPQFRQTDLVEYYTGEALVIAHLPRYGQLQLDLLNGVTTGQLIPAALDTYGVFEDLIAIGLSPHLRRRGMYLIHAFAAVRPSSAALSPEAEAGGRDGVLIVGTIGAGKTTTGMALLNAGWKLLSNDSPILSASGDILSYPGLLAAYPNTFARFEATRHLAENADPAQKLSLPAESVWPTIWLEHAWPGAILFPQIEPRTDHVLELLRQPEALRMILPHAIEQWDKAMIPAHLALLNELIQAAPAYRLRLGPETSTLPEIIASALPGS